MQGFRYVWMSEERRIREFHYNASTTTAGIVCTCPQNTNGALQNVSLKIRAPARSRAKNNMVSRSLLYRVIFLHLYFNPFQTIRAGDFFCVVRSFAPV
jgi:hypothetical protein